jgi:hypothetical protein
MDRIGLRATGESSKSYRKTPSLLPIGPVVAKRKGILAQCITVVFMSVLFFGGIGGSLRSRRLRTGFFVIALVLFVVTVVFLGTMPICKE